MSASHEQISEPTRRTVWMGVLCWVLICVAAVLVRGVRWGETYEYAQTMTGTVPYPDGYPMLRYTFGAYCLPNYLSAAMMAIGIGPAWLCGFRNVLFLCASLIPIFLIASLLARRTIWAHAAALLALQGIYLEFDGSYPLMIWPGLYSNGHIGGGWALMTLYLLMAGCWPAAFCLGAIMPCIHIGQAPPVLALIAICGLRTLWRRDYRLFRRLLFWGILGLSVSAGFLIVQKGLFTVPPPASGPYCVAGDADAIWRGYTANHDIHRLFPPGNGQVALIGLLLLAAVAAHATSAKAEPRGDGARLRPRAGDVEGDSSPCLLAFLYCLLVAAFVWDIMLVHYAIGPRIPFFLIGWMPYRLINHVAPILLACIVGLLAHGVRTQDRRWTLADLFVPAAVLYYLLLPLAPHIIGDHLYARYLARGDGLFFGLYGAAIGAMLSGTRLPKPWRIVFIAAVVCLCFYHRFGAACALLGLVIAFVLERRGAWPRLVSSRAISAILCALLLMLTMHQQWRNRQHLPVSDFDRHIVEFLHEQGEDRAMIAGPPDEFMLQARTGHPVFAEAATASYLTYVPELGPVFQKMLDEVYGFRFDQPRDWSPTPWRDLWTARSREHWQSLADTYGFRYVVTYEPMSVQLSEAFREGNKVLYRIP